MEGIGKSNMIRQPTLLCRKLAIWMTLNFLLIDGSAYKYCDIRHDSKVIKTKMVTRSHKFILFIVSTNIQLVEISQTFMLVVYEL